MADYIQNNTEQEQANILAQYLRNDPLHEAKFIEDSNLRKLLIGLTGGFIDFNNFLNLILSEGDLKEANFLLSEWERTLGIPDDCLTNNGTIEERRINLLMKLAGLQGTFIQQCEYVINLLGYSGIKIVKAIDRCQFPIQFPIHFVAEDEVPFIIYMILPMELMPATFPLPFPIPFHNTISLLQCIFDKLKPANIKIIYEFPIAFVDTAIYLSTEDGAILTLENGNYIKL